MLMSGKLVQVIESCLQVFWKKFEEKKDKSVFIYCNDSYHLNL